MEDNQRDGEEAEATSSNSNDCADVTYTFVFQNDEEEKVCTIAAEVLRRYPNCMLSRMISSPVSTRRTVDEGYIIKDRNLEMVDHIINFMQSKSLL